MLYVEPDMEIVDFAENILTDITISSDPAGEGNDDDMNAGSKLGS